jgi:hypothetical protein
LSLCIINTYCYTGSEIIKRNVNDEFVTSKCFEKEKKCASALACEKPSVAVLVIAVFPVILPVGGLSL